MVSVMDTIFFISGDTPIRHGFRQCFDGSHAFLYPDVYLLRFTSQHIPQACPSREKCLGKEVYPPRTISQRRKEARGAQVLHQMWHTLCYTCNTLGATCVTQQVQNV